jgi:gluconate 2-dehydrogenase gamma chain
MVTFISRRELLKRAGLAGAAAVVSPALASASAGRAATLAAGQLTGSAARTSVRAPLEQLTGREADMLDAVVARLIPSDATGPGALEAGATHYIDRALGGALASFRRAYTSGLAALDEFARATRGAPFVELAAAAQDAVLIDVEAGNAPGFDGGSAAFFNIVHLHTIQGTFCDPYYGGNANFVGWDLLGYPGVRTIATPEEQRLGADVAPNHKSAYDYDMFTKA